jgi:methylase of polypeptide subunit release factors
VVDEPGGADSTAGLVASAAGGRPGAGPVGPSLPPGDVERLREAFHRAGYTADGVHALLGPSAQAALTRGETVPARRRTSGGSPAETLVRLFLLRLPVEERAAAAALPLEPLVAGGLLGRDGGTVRALVDVRPYGADDGPWWVASDPGTGLDRIDVPLREDHVLGVGGASTTLAQLTVRPPVGRALDIGTGCGVQALHLSRHARTVVATDVLPRALAMARLTAALSGVELDLRCGSLLDPVEGERFDLVVSNPPFVVGAGSSGYTYRDSGLPGDEVCRRLVEQVPSYLAPGGWCQLLANWVHRRGEDWQERVGGWVRAAGCDAWAVQRDVQDPAEYVATWLRDAGQQGGSGYLDAYDRWLAALEADGVEGIGFGWISLRAGGAQSPVVRVEEWPHAVEQPLGPHVEAWWDRVEWLRSRSDEDLLAAPLAVAEDVTQEQHGAPGAEDPEQIVLRQHRGMRRAEPAGTVLAGVVGACDGSLPLGAIADAVASILEEDPSAVRRDTLASVRRLVEDGLLLPR